jgi:glycosyltransferase involved in cell wall biosynthesis
MQVARFQAIKGQMNLLDALEIMVKQDRDVDPLVVFVGGVMEPASPDVLAYKANVEVRASQPELSHYVQFLGHRDDVPLLMRAADVIVSPSEFESFSMIIIEAMAVGTPVVATAAGGPREILTGGVTGVLVPPRDPLSLADGICSVISNPDWAADLAEHAREDAVSRYGPQTRCRRLVVDYRNLLR